MIGRSLTSFMKHSFLLQFFVCLLLFLVIDGLWLGVVAQDFYFREVGSLISEQVNWVAGGFFYLVFVVGLLQFAVRPALASGDFKKAMQNGGLLGLVAYGTYDLTNLAVLPGWSLSLTVVDLIWGTVLSAIVSAGTYLIVKSITKVRS